MDNDELQRRLQEREDSIRREYARAKAKFYANPRFAGLVGLVVGVAGTLLLQWVL